MASIGPITLFREKTSVHTFDDEPELPDQDTSFTIRSNRVVLELAASHRKSQVVVRGQTIAATLRLSALVIDHFLRDSQVFQRSVPIDWADLWARKQSDFERRHHPESWVSIHADGRAAFVTRGSEAIDMIEEVAKGQDLTNDLIKTATWNLLGKAEDIVVRHESQTAVVFSPFPTHLRAAVLERRGGRTGSFSVSAFHQTDRKIRLSAFINFLADLVEAITLKELMERARPAGAGEEAGPVASPIPLDQIDATIERRKHCAEFVAAFERANKVQYRPERPQLIG
ncbi:hypothetical protein [Rhodospirillum rubrum]|uniref:Uncharacterized protein n=1 Tax=Rhodospirillum rubrum (strain ATCC 11170 / ATH 1.1.1 / DSM 467 / LMG 4362 / NCIMB 8255 / S1) TaxID=269796 RepID=Q2RR93_RHORT|nr:hypothetical protein [Rhodospirillum rubrum]ABC23352.1 hypothetical protein Rru_A2552 [Rhodospirillum rubrum ATCC 11170]AEO49085.1 hypothetical protein F11_13105 [Rhodospirillum rubrum F11]MBK5954996.1 hypothetical protein [Rhodospirillum rubrum]QXG79325.1 hypothetical protein KUL73_13175 [Rhodospirillum rubrum]HAQ01426.1 hypothetical protein [Rhodospirillum rubrum]